MFDPCYERRRYRLPPSHPCNLRMGYPITVALRYLASKKRNMISISTALAIGGVMLGVAALTIVMSVTGGFQEQFRDKVLGVNAHVLVLKYSVDFREYRDVMKKLENMPHVVGVAPFVINAMMVTHADHTATGVLLKGVDPEAMPRVLDLPKNITEPKDLLGKDHTADPERAKAYLLNLRRPGAKPPMRSYDPLRQELDPRGAGDPFAESDGGTESLLKLMQREVDDEMQHRPDAGDVAPSPPQDHPRNGSEGLPAPVDAGAAEAKDITPDGGYRSTLPDDDVIPDVIDPDPCKSPEQVAKMPGIVVGRTLAKQLDVGLGDCVQVTSPQIGLSFGNTGRLPIAKQFRVIAVFEAGFDQYDSKLVYTDLYEAQAFYEYGDVVTGIEMRLDDIDRADAVAKEINTRLASGIYNTMTWEQLNHGLFTALLIQQIGMSCVLGLIILVGACIGHLHHHHGGPREEKGDRASQSGGRERTTPSSASFSIKGRSSASRAPRSASSLDGLSCRFLLAYGFPRSMHGLFHLAASGPMSTTEFVAAGSAILRRRFASLPPSFQPFTLPS